MQEDKYQVENTEAIDSPALVVFTDLVEQNIRQAVSMVDARRGTFLRPHVKTHKTREVVQMMMQAGVDRFKCSTIAEAEMLAQEAAPDVLLAYQPTPLKARRLQELRTAYPTTTFSCLVDHPATAIFLSSLFADDPGSVFLDLNVGMNRTGISPDDAPALYRHCQELSGIVVKGLHAYDGHIHNTNFQQRQQEADASYALVCQVQENLLPLTKEHPLTVVLGGSPAFPIHAQRSNVECSPGTFPFWDAGYGKAFPEMKFIPAVRLLTRVISIVDEHHLCLDVGSKAVAADAEWPRVVFPDHPEATAISQSEEHLVIRVPDTSVVHWGEVWWGVPIHICPTVNLYESLHAVRDHQWRDTWEVVARRRKITI